MHSVGQPEVIPLWPGSPPGSEDWVQQEKETLQEIFSPPPGIRVVRNVTQPTLTAFLPHPSKATKTAVIICSGGGFHMLAIDHEGMDVAQWLHVQGVAAFVLKYRLVQTAVRDEDFVKQMQRLPEPNKLKELTRQVVPLAIADGQQAQGFLA